MRSARPARRLRFDVESVVDIDESLRIRLPFVDIELPLSDVPDVPDDSEPEVPDDIEPDVPDVLFGAVVVLPGDDIPCEPDVLGAVVLPVALDCAVPVEPAGIEPIEPAVEPVEPGVVVLMEPDVVPGVAVPVDGEVPVALLPVEPAVLLPVEVVPLPAAGSVLVAVPGFDMPGLPVVPVAGPGVIVPLLEPAEPVEPEPGVLVCASAAEEPIASDNAAARPRREGVRGFMVMSCGGG